MKASPCPIFIREVTDYFTDSLVKAKRRQILKQTGHLACAACDGNYKRTYGSVAARVFEVHHLSALGDLEDAETETTLEQLALVCANCHRILHRTRPRSKSRRYARFSYQGPDALEWLEKAEFVDSVDAIT